MPPFLANLRPRSLPRSNHHIPTECIEAYQTNNNSSNSNINSTSTGNMRQPSQIHDDHSNSSSFLANLRPRSTADNNNRNVLPNARSHNNNDADNNVPIGVQEHTFTANFRPRSHSSQETHNSKSYLHTTFSPNHPQERSFSRLWLRSKNKASSTSQSQSSLPSRSHTNSQESTASSNLPPRAHTNSQESSSSSSTMRPRSSLSSSNTRPRSPVQPQAQDKSSSQEKSSSRLNLRPRSQSSAKGKSSSRLNLRPRSQASSQDKSSSRLSMRPRSQVNPLQSNESNDRPRSPVNFLSNFRRAHSTILEDQLPADPLQSRMASDMDMTHRRGATLPRRRSRRGMRRFPKNNNNNNTDNATDSTQIHKAHLARLQVNAAVVLTRAVKRVYVKKTVLNSLKELDALIHYAELDLRTIPVVSKRIMAIQSANNIVVEKQLQAASYLYALRKKPENEAVCAARNIMNSAAGLLENENDKTATNNSSTSEQVESFSKMERSLCETANTLGEISKNCSVREQVLELLVLMTRKRAEIEIKAAIALSSKFDGHGQVESDESFTSEEEEYSEKKEADDDKENGSPKCVQDNICDTDDDIDDSKIYEAAKMSASFELAASEENAAAVISRSWNMKKLEASKALAYLMRLRTVERDMASCGSLSIYDKLTSEARLLLKSIAVIDDRELCTVASYKHKSEWDCGVVSGRRNAAISTVIRSVRLWTIRREGIREGLCGIEAIVNSAAVDNTEAGYKASLERLDAFADGNTCVVRRKVISGRNALLQKQRQLHRSSARISELRAIEKQAEVNKLEKALVENKADDYMNWWTQHGKLKGELRALLATLHRILPAWDAHVAEEGNTNSNVNMRRLYKKALLLVHPDRLAKARKADAFDEVLAQKIFVELQHAYDVYVENEGTRATYSATNFG